MYWLEFLATVGATGAVVNAWLHKGGLFENWRDAIGVWGLQRPAGQLPGGEASYGYPTLSDTVRANISRLCRCRVCLSYHVAFWLLVLFFIPSLWLSPPWDVVWFLPVYALAATRFSLLIGTAATALDIENDPEVD